MCGVIALRSSILDPLKRTIQEPAPLSRTPKAAKRDRGPLRGRWVRALLPLLLSGCAVSAAHAALILKVVEDLTATGTR